MLKCLSIHVNCNYEGKQINPISKYDGGFYEKYKNENLTNTYCNAFLTWLGNFNFNSVSKKHKNEYPSCVTSISIFDGIVSGTCWLGDFIRRL